MAPYRPNRKTKRNKNTMSDNPTNNEEAPGVGLGDLVAVLKIIDVASERGAFKGAELSSVGSVRDKIAAFVDANAPKQEDKSEEETTAGEEATEETSE